MRTGTKKCILLLLAIIVLCFAVWLLWPHSFAEVTGIPERLEINLSGVVVAARVENGQPSFDTWDLQNCAAGSAEYEAVLSVLQASFYRQDPRNLLPGERTSVGSGKGYDSRSVLLIFVWGPGCGGLLQSRVLRHADGRQQAEQPRISGLSSDRPRIS